ncbi:MAG: tRNA (adenosine(37)-N6)-dimethylallyltransferase MiaA [Marinovum algicola]|jgi:tRNA dimethylallyltransferase|uniref:tRNA dimethylallyltransferase n=1 Tax=Marinovum algicola TaxID=42444 RepID=A0A975W8D2_9RHOB|nr:MULTISPECIES: tRNA (adenosine(37)-N6)-dimethylallyltransferase MiaA [Marinovum]MDD9740794.1 tRNA (adenosine(37)-N6)-dimethylallyltransferase MiaA [Marinovum sp. SP66]SEJ07749.1 tRNA dimethylallyltransferase [Marinovum algicola]SLN19818.1 tRNA dimethylallyltransferase [Marinovum algicola]
MRLDLANLSPERSVLIAGPTASGKSALALEIAERQGGVIVNADAIQVFENWRVLTARPGAEDLARARHVLYGHVAWDAAYSVGHWLREVAPLLSGPERAIIIGGTGLYFAALTEGLAEIPATPPEVRAEADARRLDQGHDALLPEIDPETRARLDTRNPMRVQRAWEVQRATGRGLASWQDATPEPLLPLAQAQALRVDVERDWLNARIARRFDLMLAQGALDEARANLARWDPALLSFKAIGAPELIAHLHGEIPLEDAREKATIATCQFAKRQRTWLRSRMKAWQGVEAAALC